MLKRCESPPPHQPDAKKHQVHLSPSESRIYYLRVCSLFNPLHKSNTNMSQDMKIEGKEPKWFHGNRNDLASAWGGWLSFHQCPKFGAGAHYFLIYISYLRNKLSYSVYHFLNPIYCCSTSVCVLSFYKLLSMSSSVIVVIFNWF